METVAPLQHASVQRERGQEKVKALAALLVEGDTTHLPGSTGQSLLGGFPSRKITCGHLDGQQEVGHSWSSTEETTPQIP